MKTFDEARAVIEKIKQEKKQKLKKLEEVMRIALPDKPEFSVSPRVMLAGGGGEELFIYLESDSDCIVLAETLKKNAEILEKIYLVVASSNGRSCRDKVTEKGLIPLALAVMSDKTMKSITMSHFNMNVNVMEVISDALRTNSTLKEMEISYCKLEDLGAIALAPGLKANSGLESLDIRGCRIGALGTKGLSEALRSNRTLKGLTMNQNMIGDLGAEFLGEAFKANNSLTSLEVNNCAIGALGAIALGNALKINRGLQKIDLTNNPIGDIGITAINEMLKINQSLRSVSLWYQEMSGHILAEVHAKLKLNEQISQLPKKDPAILSFSQSSKLVEKSGDLTVNIAVRRVRDLGALIPVLEKCMIEDDKNVLPEPELALLRAAATGDVDSMEKLIKLVKDLDINHVGSCGNTALMLAGKNSQEAAYEFLLKAGALEPKEASEKVDYKQKTGSKFV